MSESPLSDESSLHMRSRRARLNRFEDSSSSIESSPDFPSSTKARARRSVSPSLQPVGLAREQPVRGATRREPVPAPRNGRRPIISFDLSNVPREELEKCKYYDFNDLETIFTWVHTRDKTFRITKCAVPGVLRTTAASIRQVNSAYNLAASTFVTKWLALYDRAIKTKLREMARQTHGNAIEKLQNYTSGPKDIEKRRPNPLDGLIILRPVAMAIPVEGQDNNWNLALYPGTTSEEKERLETVDNKFIFLQKLNLVTGDEPPSQYEFGPKLRSHVGDKSIVLGGSGKFYTSSLKDSRRRNAAPRQPAAASTRDEAGAADETSSFGPNLQLEETVVSRANEEADKSPGDLFTVYSQLKGYLGETGSFTRLDPTQYSADLWDSIVRSEWSRDLPARETLQIKGYVAHARDATTFAALRLDLLGDRLKSHFDAIQSDASESTLNFDAIPLPFEERLHKEDQKTILKKLDTLARWMTLCLYDNEEVPVAGFEQEALRERQRAQQELPATTTRSPVPETIVKVSIACHRFWKNVLQNDVQGIDMEYEPNIATIFDAPFNTLQVLCSKNAEAFSFHDDWKNKQRLLFESTLQLTNVRDQTQVETHPYTPPFVDFSTQDGFVWGSTITPFLLAVSAVPVILSLLLKTARGPSASRGASIGGETAGDTADGGQSQYPELNYEKINGADDLTNSETFNQFLRKKEDERFKNYEYTPPTFVYTLSNCDAKNLSKIFWDRFKGMPIPNTKRMHMY